MAPPQTDLNNELQWECGSSVIGQSKIPRLIHQTFPTKILPTTLRENVDKLQAMNRECEYKIYDDSDIEAFIASQGNSRLLTCFSRLNPNHGAARADLFRYVLLYQLGGVYLDIKSSVVRPLREVLKPGDSFLISQWRNDKGGVFEGWGLYKELEGIKGGEFQQWYIAASPRHPFLKAVIDTVLANIENYNPLVHELGKPAVLRTTGPIAYTLAIAPLLPFYEHRFLARSDSSGFIYSIFEAFGQFAHVGLFKQHYGSSPQPLVLGFRNSVFALLFRMRRKWRSLLGIA